MNKTLLNFILIFILGFALINCANRGNPDGGPKDETPPSIVKSEPENYSTNFNETEITITFDEYIKIKDLQKQLIISPPMKNKPDVRPIGSASKEITIKINDTLLANTTYAFNFGNSITDNNEGNPYPYYRYVFSTGDYIDSLKVTGTIADALYEAPETFINVALYEIDSTFTDSIIYKEVPKYITNTLDSVTSFSIENIKPGKYMLMALKDGNGDNVFQQRSDQIGFYKDFIEVPTDSSYTLRLFSETPDFRATRPQLLSGGKIAFGFEGDYKDMNIEIISDTPSDFEYRIFKDKATDSLFYWYKPKLEVDSLLFKVTHPAVAEKDFTVRVRDMKRDSLIVSVLPSGDIGYQENMRISGSTPLTKFDISKVTLIDKDSLPINFTSKFDSITNTYDLNFDKTEDNGYLLQLLPEAVTDFFGDTNDSLSFSVRTRKESDFGYVRFTLNNAVYPLIIQLTNNKGEVVYEEYAKAEGPIDFLNLKAGTYAIRVIHDVNGNEKYDTGNYLKKIQPERVSHFQSVEIRADWGIAEILEFK